MSSNLIVPREITDNEIYYCDRDSATAAGRYLTCVEWNFITKYLCRPPIRKQCILDVGGGSGRFAMPLYAMGMDVIVEEVNSLPLRLLHKNNPAIPAILQDPQLKSFPFNDQVADYMLCIEVPDLTESDWFFPEARRILKRGGLLIFTTHNRCSYKGFYKKILLKEDGKSDDWYKIHYKSNYSQVKDRLARAGFNLIEALGFHWIPVSRASNNKLTPLFMVIERSLRLGSMVTFSPWIIMAVRKV
jgi:SAM-dependent methyltransferase